MKNQKNMIRVLAILGLLAIVFGAILPAIQF
jgi:hypothetical protein